MNSNWGSYVLHIIAGALIASAPLLTAGVPLSWQTMTVGGIAAACFKWAHDYMGY